MKILLIFALAAATTIGCGKGAPDPEAPAPEDRAATRDGAAEPQELGAVSTYVPTDAEGRVARLGDMLMGRVPGLEVTRRSDGRYSLRIRGPRTLRGSGSNEEPLLVVDGTPVPDGSTTAALNAIAPRDVASVRVLRDASSTSIYGMRGANGVVVITTKKGTRRPKSES